MDETRYQEYWKLICTLLNCPNGEEDDILKTNQYLIDDILVKIILEIANSLKVQGNLKSADFLMNIAGYLIGVYRNLPLQKILTPTAISKKQNVDFQLDFCLKMLQSSRNIKSFLNILSPLLQANLNQLNDNFAQLLRSWAITTLCSSPPQTSYWIAVNIGNFSQLIKNFPLGNRASNLEIAMTGYEVTDIVITCSEYPYDWAMAKNNLGTVYLDRIRGDRVENLTAAIGYFHDALKIFTREAFPIDWAITQNNLGISYLEMGTSCLGSDFVYRTLKEQEEDLENAIRCLQNALEVNTHEAFPIDWARIQYNLGLCYMHRLQRNQAENLEAAISCFSDVLRVYTREAFPFDWAWTQSSLGEVYRQRMQGDKAENLNAAICCHLAALKVRTKDAFPSDHAGTQYLTLQDGRVIDLKKCLTLDDIFNLNLEKCRLVVLSACETGITDHTNFSDEYIGLPSGFLYAGSPNVVNSLWKVSDISTAFLIAKFYENLQNESSVAVALNHAQFWLRDATGDELKQWMEEKQFPLNRTLKISLLRQFKHNPQPFQSPFHWAAFCAIGQ